MLTGETDKDINNPVPSYFTYNLFTNRYDIIVSGIKGQSTIETVVFNEVKTSNGVEYLIGEIQ